MITKNSPLLNSLIFGSLITTLTPLEGSASQRENESYALFLGISTMSASTAGETIPEQTRFSERYTVACKLTDTLVNANNIESISICNTLRRVDELIATDQLTMNNLEDIDMVLPLYIADIQTLKDQIDNLTPITPLNFKKETKRRSIRNVSKWLREIF